MKMQWEKLTPKRPDRYIDWSSQVELFDGDPNTRWTSVLIQMDAGNPSAEPSLAVLDVNMKQLGKMINNTDQSGPFQILMNKDEEVLFHAWHKKVKDSLNAQGMTLELENHEDVRFSFFAYMLEVEIYKNGAFKNFELFTIRMSGPPIQKVTVANKRTDFPMPALQGNEVAIGVIDDGIAFAHDRFRQEGRITSKILAFWDQDIEVISENSRVTLGQVYLQDEINKLISSDLPSGKIYVPLEDREVYRKHNFLRLNSDHPRSLIFQQTHGAHIMDVASPQDQDDVTYPLFSVQLPQQVSAATSGVSLASYFLQGLRQIMNWADNYADANSQNHFPLVINFSYGFTAGPKDGWHQIVHEVDRLVRERNDRKHNRMPTAVVMPAGNSYDDRMTAILNLQPRASKELDWVIKPDDRTESFLEIWLEPITEGSHDMAIPLELTISPPRGEPTTFSFQGKTAHTLVKINKKICGLYFDLEKRVGNELRPRIFIAVNRTNNRDADNKSIAAAPSGHWTLSFKNTDEKQVLRAECYIQRDDTPVGFDLLGRQSYFDHDAAYERDNETGVYNDIESNPECPITHKATLNAIASSRPHTGQQSVIMVGAADNTEKCKPARYTASGDTKANNGPRFSAVCEEGRAFGGIYGAGGLSGYMVPISGTSVAAAQLTKAVAGAYDFETKRFELDRMCTEYCLDDGSEASRRLGKVLTENKPAQLKDRLPYQKRRYDTR